MKTLKKLKTCTLPCSFVATRSNLKAQTQKGAEEAQKAEEQKRPKTAEEELAEIHEEEEALRERYAALQRDKQTLV